MNSQRRALMAGLVAGAGLGPFAANAQDKQGGSVTPGPAGSPDASSAPLPPPSSANTSTKAQGLSEARGPSFPGAPQAPSGTDGQSVTRGREPLSRDEASWQQIQQRFGQLYPELAESGGKTAFIQGTNSEFYSKGVEGAFKFTKRPEDELFRYNHCEILLNQAADLLDRCLQYRSEWEDKSAKAANLGIEIADYFRNEAIHQEEIENGIYTVPYETSDRERQAQQWLSDASGTSKSIIDSQISARWSMDALNEQSGYQQLGSWLSKLVTYQYPFAGNELDFIWNGTTNKASEFMRNAAFKQGFWAFYNQLDFLQVQRLGFAIEQFVGEQRRLAFESKATWDLKDIDFKRRRTQVARDLADYKVKLSTDPGGPFNYVEQIASRRLLFSRDFRDALARLMAAESGLQKIYAYVVPLPARIQKLVSDQANDPNTGLLDECVGWVRDAIAWLIRFSDTDEAYTLAVSLREQSDKDAWTKGLQSGSWTFDINDSLLPRQAHVRLRGVSAFVEGVAQEGVWSLRVDAPRTSSYTYLDGHRINVNQTVPIVRLGRVGRRRDSPTYDVGGRVSLYNLSPFGAWTVSISPVSTSGEALKDLKNLVIDLDLAVRSV